MKRQQPKSIAEISPLKQEQIGYSWKDRLKNYQVLFMILATALFSFVLLRFGIYLVALFLRKDSFAFVDNPSEFVGIVMGVFVIYQLAHTTFNLFPGLRISRDGLEVQVFDRFHYTWQFVPWTAVQAIYPVIKYGWFPKSSVRPTYLIEIENLSSWHRWFSFVFGNGHLHALIIQPNFPRGEILLDKIRDHLHEREMDDEKEAG